VLTIPRLAVLNPGGATLVYVEKSPGTYERRAVKLGRTGTDLVEVLDGLVAGDRVVATGNLLIDAQAQLDQGAASPDSETPKPGSATKAAQLSSEQRQALEKAFTLAAELAAALAADDLKALQDRSMGLHSIVPAAAEKLAGAAGWSTHMDAANRAAHFPIPQDLATARARFNAFVTPVVELAKLARLSGQNPAPRIFQCPMTKKSFQNAPTNALWLQLGSGPIRNPYFGAEMLDCGTEVKP
jgi:Cu(I)/Ag(I) efflux system membrane fusion protein